MTTTYYSENGEEYRHEDLEEAVYAIIEDDADLEVGYVISVWEGKCRFRKASSYAPDVFEDMQNQAYDELPDFADNWPNVTKDQSKELVDSINELIDKWADKYNQQPAFGLMSNCKERFFKITKMAEMASDIEYEETHEPVDAVTEAN